ncbi:helix-turn-helix domain-containing protein [Polyangium jinanense]|uniref:Helix-turn-helix transcriptional regulator n=1 Tax=Polyangium jinanense TaxID=2829994 RepID=A0A9X3XCF8_9BACT|nr:helix-turn-helix transcriptional regulator [Polyangium jinanense]MDC3959534.1 helix-turn-helix transcriptional regulator [Polyangium jinanense]MDC3986133.1 helix-turn-helix transcriptional regulator [Polyangium jinanense]
MLDLVAELGGSLDLHEVLGRGYGLLSQLVSADHGALCVSRPEGHAVYDWAVVEMPERFFQGYAEMVPHDFVRIAVAERPNEVLRDTEMLARAAMERSYLYNHCRDIGMRLEHVMAVMLRDDPAWHGGLILYRDKRVPFSDHERMILQKLSRHFTNAVKNCRLFGAMAKRASLLDAVLAGIGHEAIVFSASGAEIARTASAEKMLQAWFRPIEFGPDGLPEPLAARLASIVKNPHTLTDAFWRSGALAELKVSIQKLPGMDAASFVMLFEEVPQLVPIPLAWLKVLSSAELKVAERVCWDNALIASELGITELTVKKHFSHIFDKLGIPNRAALIHMAWRQR